VPSVQISEFELSLSEAAYRVFASWTVDISIVAQRFG
jgi:hypothetical protein